MAIAFVNNFKQDKKNGSRTTFIYFTCICEMPTAYNTKKIIPFC